MPINLSGSANRAAATVFGSGIIKSLRNQNKINEQLTEANATAQDRLQIAMNQKRDTEYQVANVKNQDAINLSKRKQHLFDVAYASYMDSQPPIDPNIPSESFTVVDENGNKVYEDRTASGAEMAAEHKVNKNDLSEAMDFGSNLAWRLTHRIYGDSPITSTMSRIGYEDLAKSGLLYDYAQYSNSFTYDDLDQFVDYVLGEEFKDGNLTAADYDGDYDNTKFMDKSRYDFIHKLRNDFKNRGGDK